MLTDAMFVIGALCVCAGLYLLQPPLVLLFVGALLLTLAITRQRREAERILHERRDL